MDGAAAGTLNACALGVGLTPSSSVCGVPLGLLSFDLLCFFTSLCGVPAMGVSPDFELGVSASLSVLSSF